MPDGGVHSKSSQTFKTEITSKAPISRSSRTEVFCKKDVLRNVAKFTENPCARVSLIKLLASGLQLYLKRDSGAVVFL